MKYFAGNKEFQHQNLVAKLLQFFKVNQKRQFVSYLYALSLFVENVTSVFRLNFCLKNEAILPPSLCVRMYFRGYVSSFCQQEKEN